jgi:hypothetical protein
VTGQMRTGEPADQIVRVLWAMIMNESGADELLLSDQASPWSVVAVRRIATWPRLARRLSSSLSCLLSCLRVARARLVFVQHTV